MFDLRPSKSLPLSKLESSPRGTSLLRGSHCLEEKEEMMINRVNLNSCNVRVRTLTHAFKPKFKSVSIQICIRITETTAWTEINKELGQIQNHLFYQVRLLSKKSTRKSRSDVSLPRASPNRSTSSGGTGMGTPRCNRPSRGIAGFMICRQGDTKTDVEQLVGQFKFQWCHVKDF